VVVGGGSPPDVAHREEAPAAAHRAGGDYSQARATRTALEAFRERVGVCRDYTHLAVAFCRCMNIPARYCTGYLGDIGVPASPEQKTHG